MKAALALNGAMVVRVLRCGPGQAKKRLMDAYHAVDPFSRVEHRKEVLLLNRIPQVKLSELTAGTSEIVLDMRYAEVAGSTPVVDLVSILALAVAQQPRAIVEFGTFWGSGTANLARNLPNATVHTIDLPPERAQALAMTAGRPVDDVYLIESRQLGRAFRGTPLEARIVQHLGDTATYDYAVIQDEISFFLIDGSHTYEYAKNDTLKAFGLARGLSSFVWHDCDEIHPGVTRWLGELIDAGLPVKRVEGTAVACLRVEAEDAKVQSILRG